jgi:hypothetical protein
MRDAALADAAVRGTILTQMALRKTKAASLA